MMSYQISYNVATKYSCLQSAILDSFIAAIYCSVIIIDIIVA